MQGFLDYNPVKECWLCGMTFTARLAGQVICDREHPTTPDESHLTFSDASNLEHNEGR